MPAQPVVLAVFDLDGTITRRDTLVPMVLGYLWRHPWRLPRLLGVVPTITRYLCGAADRGELKGSLLHCALGGLSRAQIDAWSNGYVRRVLRRGLFAEAMERIREHRANGHRLILLSASVDLYVPKIGAALGFIETRCSQVRWRDDDRLDGRLASPNYRDQEKVRQVQALQQQWMPSETVAYGNSRADLPHLCLANRGYFVNGSQSALPKDCVQVQIVRWCKPYRV